MSLKKIKLPNSFIYPVTVDEVHVRHGQKVLQGDPIYTLADQTGKLVRIKAPTDGAIDGEPAARHTRFDGPQVVSAIRTGTAAASQIAPEPDQSFADPSDPALFEPWRTLDPLDGEARTAAPTENPPKPAPPPTAAPNAPPTPRTSSPKSQPRTANPASPTHTRSTGRVFGRLAVGVGVVGVIAALAALPATQSFLSKLFGDGRVAVDPAIESPVAARLERNLNRFRDSNNFGIVDAHVERGELFVTVAHQGASSTARSIHLADVDVMELAMFWPYFSVGGSLTVRLFCAVPDCVTTHRLTDDMEAVTGPGFTLDDDVLNFRLYYPSSTSPEEVYRSLDEIFELAELYGNTDLTWRNAD